MKKQIRQGVFETNSSSTHSICIAKDVEINLPDSLHFEFGEFGWERDTLQTTHDKASYLYTGLIANNRNEDINNIIQLLLDKGIDVTFEKAVYSTNKYINSDGKECEYVTGDNIGYVDHSGEMYDFLNDVCDDENKLIRYLFSELSFIITGNDNDDNDVNINVSYPHDEYYKGN